MRCADPLLCNIGQPWMNQTKPDNRSVGIHNLSGDCEVRRPTSPREMPSVGLTYEMVDGMVGVFQTARAGMAAVLMFLTQVRYRRDEAQPIRDFINGWLGD